MRKIIMCIRDRDNNKFLHPVIRSLFTSAVRQRNPY